MTIKFEVIKPPKFSPNAFKQELERQVVRAAETVRKDFLGPTANWKEKPTFVKNVVWKGLVLVLEFLAEVGTPGAAIETSQKANKVYLWLSDGTKDHDIAAKNKRILHWGGDTASRHHRVKGIKPRGYLKAVEAKWEVQFPVTCQQALDDAVKFCGHNEI